MASNAPCEDKDDAEADDTFEADFKAADDDEDDEEEADDENLRGVLTERRAIGSSASTANAAPIADAEADVDE